MAQKELSCRSVYNGHEVYPNGDFRNFVIDVHEHAKQYGHWRFGGQENLSQQETRAFCIGFQSPEHLLIAYNHGAHGPWHREIILKWIPGNTDIYQVVRSGTAGQHMATIAQERTLLGLPPLLAHEIPGYPISLHPALQLCREGRYFGGSLLAPLRPTPNIPAGFNPSRKSPPNSAMREGPKGLGQGSVPSASPNQNMPPPQSHRGRVGMAPIPPARTAAVPSLHPQYNKGRDNVGLAVSRAHNPSLFAQNQARAPAIVASARTLPAHAAAQQELPRIPLYQQQARPRPAEQPHVVQQHERLPDGGAVGVTSYATESTPNARRGPSSSTLFIPNTPRTTLSAPIFPNRPQIQLAEAGAPLATDTQVTRSYKIAVPSQIQQHLSPSSQSSIAAHVAHSSHFTQHLRGAPNQSVPPQPSAASHPPSYAFPRTSMLGAPYRSSNPPLPLPPRGIHSPANAAASIATQPSPFHHPSQINARLSDVLESGVSGEVHSKTNKRQEAPGPKAIITDEVPLQEGLDPLPKSVHINGTALLPPTEATSRQVLELTLGSLKVAVTEVGPVSSVPEQGKTAVRLPKQPTTMTNSDHSRQNQQKGAEGQPLAKHLPAVLDDAAKARQGPEKFSSPRGKHPAMAIDHHGLVALDSQEGVSTSIAKDQSPNLTSPISIAPQSPSVGGQQHDNQHQGQRREPVPAVDPRLSCAQCKRVPKIPEAWTTHCSGCKDVWYCSSPCQRAAWKSHSTLCMKTEQPQSTLPEISVEVTEIGARYNPRDEFSTALMSLSQNVPCMICEGTQEHQPDCMAAGECCRCLFTSTVLVSTVLKYIQDRSEYLERAYIGHRWLPLSVSLIASYTCSTAVIIH
ncbi:hypothetical protein PMIN03_006633 [Paraphaeosphaeria minitans]